MFLVGGTLSQHAICQLVDVFVKSTLQILGTLIIFIYILYMDPVGMELLTLLLAFNVNAVLFSHFVSGCFLC